jgi:hypothetical protein
MPLSALVHGGRDDDDLPHRRERLRHGQKAGRAHAVVVGQENAIGLRRVLCGGVRRRQERECGEEREDGLSAHANRLPIVRPGLSAV